MQEIIERVYQSKLKDGTIEKIFGQRIDKMVNDVLDDLMGYRGEVRREFRDRIAPLLIESVEHSDLGEMTVKLTHVIDEGIKHTEVAMYKKLLDGVRTLCQQQTIEFQQKVKMSEIFKRYMDFVHEAIEAGDVHEASVETDDVRSAVFVPCTLYVEEVENKSYWGTVQEWRVELTNEIGEHTDTRFTFIIRKQYDGHKHVRTDYNMKIGDLPNMPPFAVYLLMLEQRWADIEIDVTEDRDNVLIEFDD